MAVCAIITSVKPGKSMMWNAPRRWWGCFIAAVFLVLPGSHTWACSVVPPQHADSIVLATPVIFRGRVVAIQAETSAGVLRQQVTLQVLERWKGVVGIAVVVRVVSHRLNSCGGVPMPPNFEGLVFAGRDAEGALGSGGVFDPYARNSTEVLARLREERAAADALVAASPGEIRPLLNRARMLRRWRDHEEALVAYRAIAELAPDLTEPVIGISHSLVAQRKAQEALAVLAAAEARLGPHRDIAAARAIARLASGERDDLQRLDLRGADLSGLDLSRRDLRGADFSGALLTSINFEQSDLRGARFVGTRFDDVRMEHANLEGAAFTAPIGFPRIQGANLARSRLDRVVQGGGFHAVNFIGGNLESATISESRLERVTFRRTRMQGATLSTVYFSVGTISETDFRGATLRDVTFSSFWVEANAASELLRAQDLRGARLINVRFE